MTTPRKIVASALPLVVLIALNTRPLAQTLHPKGTTMWNPAVARNGLTFIAAPDGTARLINMQGQVITKGRIFEITSNGDIVWEYMSPFTDVTTNTGRPVVSYLVYRAYRLPFYWPFFPVPPNGGV